MDLKILFICVHIMSSWIRSTVPPRGQGTVSQRGATTQQLATSTGVATPQRTELNWIPADRTDERVGWIVNDCLTCIPNTRTLWHDLMDWIPGLKDMTNGYTDYSILANRIESIHPRPDYIIRNGTYFRKLNIDVPTFCLIQDTYNTAEQTEVINTSTAVVFSCHHVYKVYKDRISPKHVRVIEHSSDFNFFKPIPDRHPDVLPNSILFIGDSSIEKKGFHRVLDIIENMPDFNFCLVMKDDSTMDIIPSKNRHRVRMFNRVSTEMIRLIINSCVCGICTSGYEEGHWAGIEMGACDLPMVTRPIGCYLDRISDMSWGEFAEDHEFPEKIRYVVSNRHLYSPRKYYSKEYTHERCREKWMKLIDDFVPKKKKPPQFTVEILSGLCNVLKSLVTALSIGEANILPRFDAHFDANYAEILDDSLICHGREEFATSFVTARWLLLKEEEDEQKDLVNDAKSLGDHPNIRDKSIAHLFTTKTIDWFYDRSLICDRVFNRIMKGIHKIKWKQEVLSEVNKITSQFVYPTLTIQIRTWRHRFDPANIFEINDGVKRDYNFQKYKDAIDVFLPKCSTIFLTSDNDAVLSDYKEYLKDYNVITYTQPNSVTQMQYSAATMLIGSQADMLVCSRLSTFAECMWWFGGCKADVIPVF
jgi:glycosyltransferase involved in cell wall biosynthesis